jgi:2-polyprenyl-3-methyl-5-hydroxy-6-metoxy-1,4-benzoquinol methylase
MNPLRWVARRIFHGIGQWYCGIVNRREYRLQTFWRLNERHIEYPFVFECLRGTCPTTVLDVGTGTTALPHLIRTSGYVVTAIDNIVDYWPAGMFNRHYHVIDDDITRTRLTEQFDFVTCISVLEHILDHAAAVRGMFRLLKPGGHLVLTFPYNERQYIPNAYKLPDAGYGQDQPYVCQIYSRAQLDQWLAAEGGEIVAQQFWEVFTGEFWTCGQWLRPPRQTGPDQPHQHTCLLIRKRSGG